MEKFLPQRTLRFALPALIVVLCAGLVLAQVRAFRGGVGAPAPADGEAKAEAEGTYGDGPGLKTDPEAQQLLTRAEQFVKDERFDLAAVLWQKVLDDAGDNLVSVDGRLYISLRRQVEQRLATLPKLALQIYRVTADGEAQALLAAAGPDKEEEALSQVVRRFFMSSQGDDAAYKLGCLALDRYDFVGASRMFAKVLDEHPDPSMPRADLLLRQALAAGRVGDRDGANSYLAAIDELDGPRPSRTLLGAVAEDIQQTSAATQFVSARMAMPPLPADATSKTLTELWAYEYPMLFQEQPLGRNMAYAMYDGTGRPSTERRQIPRDQVIDRWKSNGWTPAGKLLFGDGRVYFKTNNNITCWNTEGSEKVLWESLWNNDFEIDEFSQQLVMLAMNMGMQPGMQQDTRPRTPAEILLFGDQIHQDMSLIGGKIYSIEGRKYPKKGQPENAKAPKQFNWQSTPRRTRVNYLSAYDARTGKVQWNRAADDEAKDGAEGGVGFMAAPVACGNVLLTPMTDGGSMWLYGISPDDGRTLWKTYLCDEPAGGCEPWSPMSVAVEGRDAYVLCGAGVVFAVDGTSGAVRWVVRYKRTPKGTSGRRIARNPYGGSRLEEYSGWVEDKLIPLGRQLVVMASDHDMLLCLDCRSGEKLWDSPRTLPGGPAVDYCIGVKGRGVYVAGRTSVRRYDIPTGKFTWEYPGRNDPPMESFGRGVLTDDSVYVPVKDSVVKLALDKREADKSQALSQVGVRLTSPDPVGNLYSDGEKMWVLSANRIYSLTHLEYRMQALEKRIDAGDAEALLDRMRLVAKNEQWDQAMEDLRNAYALISKQQDDEAAANAVFGVIDELKLTAMRPAAVLDALAKIFAEGTTSLKPEQRVKLDGVLSSSLAALPRVKSPESAASLLAAAPLYKQEFLVLTASRSLKAVAAAGDKAALEAAVTAGKEPASLIAAEAWAILDPEAARPVLRPWLGSGDNKVKLLTARALLQAGDSTAIPTLIDMLGAGDIPTCNRAFQTLRAATGKNDLVYVAYAAADDRNKQIKSWRDWYESNKDSVRLSLPLPDAGTQLGRTLVCSQGRSQVVELDAAGKVLSTKTVPQCWSGVGLPNGNRLIAVTTQPKVIEYDGNWKEVWSVDGLPAGTWSVDRSLDGATVLACADAAQIIEIKSGTKDKKVLWRGDGSGRPVYAKRLESGNTLICLQGLNKVIEIDAAGKQVWEAGNLLNPFSAQRLENGNTLVAAMVNGANGSIVEVDSGGKQVKIHKQGLRQLYAAERLVDGSIMYCDQQGLHKIDTEGKTTFSRREANITGFSNF